MVQLQNNMNKNNTKESINNDSLKLIGHLTKRIEEIEAFIDYMKQSVWYIKGEPTTTAELYQEFKKEKH